MFSDLGAEFTDFGEDVGGLNHTLHSTCSGPQVVFRFYNVFFD